MCQKTEGTPKRKIIFLTEGNIRTQQPTFQEGGLKASGITPLYYTIYKHLCNLLPTLFYSETTQNKKLYRSYIRNSPISLTKRLYHQHYTINFWNNL